MDSQGNATFYAYGGSQPSAGMYGSYGLVSYSNAASGFGTNIGSSTNVNDTAELFGSSGNNTLYTDAAIALLYGNNYAEEASGFKAVNAIGGSGLNTEGHGAVDYKLNYLGKWLGGGAKKQGSSGISYKSIAAVAGTPKFRSRWMSSCRPGHAEFAPRPPGVGVFLSPSGGDSCESVRGSRRGPARAVSIFCAKCCICWRPPNGEVQKFRRRSTVEWSAAACPASAASEVGMARHGSLKTPHCIGAEWLLMTPP